MPIDRLCCFPSSLLLDANGFIDIAVTISSHDKWNERGRLLVLFTGQFRVRPQDTLKRAGSVVFTSGRTVYYTKQQIKNTSEF